MIEQTASAPPQSTAMPAKRRRHRRTIHGMLPEGVPDMIGARVFVSLVFLLIGASFVASTAIFIREFWNYDWLGLMLLHSHLFLFFPTLGLLALVAFHLPATVFAHMYWTYIPHGRIRFLIGTLAVLGLTWMFSTNLLTTGPREVWEIAPGVLDRDASDPPGCKDGRQSCRRAGLMDGVSSLRVAAQERYGMSKFARVCRADPLLETPDDFTRERFCFASNGKLTGEACCRAQERFGSHLDEVWTTPANRSQTDAFDLIALPLKTFFVLIVITIGALLVIWRKLLETRYALIAPAIERALLIGAVAMLPWPFMDYAYVEGMQTLSGRWSATAQVRLSLVIAPWALLLLVFFLQRMGRKIERLGQLAGAFVSLVAILRYDQLSDVAVRWLGVGAPIWMIGALIVISFLCLAALRWPSHMQRGLNGLFGRHPDAPSPTASVPPK